MEEELRSQQAERGLKAYLSFRRDYLLSNNLVPSEFKGELESYIHWEWVQIISKTTKKKMMELIQEKRQRQLSFLSIYQDKGRWKKYSTSRRRSESSSKIKKQIERSRQSTHGMSLEISHVDDINVEKEEKGEKQYQFQKQKKQNKIQSQSFEKRQQINIESQESMSSIQSRITQNYSDKSKLNKEGKCRVYYCEHCDKKHKFRPRIKSHKAICQVRLAKKKRQKFMKKNDESLLFFQSNQTLNMISNTMNEKELVLIEQNRILRQQLAKFQGKAFHETEQQIKAKSQKIAHQIINSASETIMESFASKLTSSLFKKISQQTNFQELSTKVRVNLVNKINQMDLQQIVFSQGSSIVEAHNILLQNSTDKSSRTVKNYLIGRNFFDNFTDFDLCYQSRVIYHLAKWRAQIRNIYINYYSQLRKFSPQLPQLVQISCIYPWRAIPPIRSFGLIVNSISELADKENLILITDMWMYVCLGLRPQQFKRIRVVTQNGAGALLIKIKQLISHRTITRYIPKSLIQLVKFSKASYPISEERLCRIRDVFYETNANFYALRHLHSFNLLEAAHRAFGNCYFYGIQERESLPLSSQIVSELDTIYSFNFPFRQEFQQQRVMIDFIQNKESQLGGNTQFITIDKNEFIFQGYQDDFILRNLTPDILQKAELPNKQKEDLILRSRLYQEFRKEIAQGNMNVTRTGQLIDQFSDMLRNQHFGNFLEEELSRKGLMLNNENVLTIAANFINKGILILHQNGTKAFLPQYSTIFDKRQAILLVQNEDGIKLVNRELTSEQFLKKIDETKTSLTENKKKKEKLSQLQPKCQKCKQILEMKIDEECHGYLCCDRCQVQFRVAYPKAITFKPSSEVVFKGNTQQKISWIDNPISFCRQKNNLRQQVQKSHGKNVFSTETKYSTEVPKQIQTNFSLFSQKVSKLIQENREQEQFLPLAIRKSTVQKAGKGIFTLKQIPQNTVLLSYIGTIATNFTSNMNNNSLFALGWLHINGVPHELLINTDTTCNSARFINSCDKDHPENCKPVIGISNKELTVVIVSSEKIKKGAELFYQYGQHYWVSESNSNQQEYILEKYSSLSHSQKMENKFQQIGFVPKVYPSQKQLQKFEQYVEKLENQYSHSDIGAIQIVSPTQIPSRYFSSMQRQKVVRKFQKISPIRGSSFYKYQTVHEDTVSFKEFWNKDDQQLNLTQDIEFWRSLEMNEIKHAEYAPDNNKSLLFLDKRIDKQYKTFFNQIVSEQIKGINTPFVFVGKRNSVFGLHTEDYHLSAINFHLHGSPKIWYVAPSHQKESIDSYILSRLPKSERKCEQPLLHKQLLINPYELLQAGFKIHKIYQKPGDIVVTFPKAYHFGFNTGNNINQAFNFGTSKWISPLLSFKKCTCECVNQLNKKSFQANLEGLKNTHKDVYILRNEIIEKLEENNLLQNDSL